MIDGARHLDSADAARLAQLHRATLRTSTLGRMGLAPLARYYRWAAVSPDERLFVSRTAEGIDGAAVLSVDPDTALRRFVMRAPFRFAASAMAAAIRDREFRRELVAYGRERLRAASEPGAAPELLQIYVDPFGRNRGVGSRLLARVEQAVTTAGLDRYYARTVVQDNEATLGFYARRGFTAGREQTFCGVRYVLLCKHLTGTR